METNESNEVNPLLDLMLAGALVKGEEGAEWHQHNLEQLLRTVEPNTAIGAAYGRGIQVGLQQLEDLASRLHPRIAVLRQLQLRGRQNVNTFAEWQFPRADDADAWELTVDRAQSASEAMAAVIASMGAIHALAQLHDLRNFARITERAVQEFTARTIQQAAQGAADAVNAAEESKS